MPVLCAADLPAGMGHTVPTACKLDWLRTSEAALIVLISWVEGALSFVLPGPSGRHGQKDAQALAERKDPPVASRYNSLAEVGVRNTISCLAGTHEGFTVLLC